MSVPAAPNNASGFEKVGDLLVSSVVAMFGNDGQSFPLPAFGPRTPALMPKRRVQVSAASFSRATDQMAQDPTGKWFYCHKRGTVAILVVTPRASDPNVAQDSDHGVAVGRARYLMNRTAQRLTPNNAAGLGIIDIIDLGESVRVDEATDTDRTELRFQIDALLPPSLYTAS